MSDMNAMVASAAASGWLPVSVSADHSVLHSANTGNSGTHVACAIISLLTFGLFLPVWLLVALFGNDRRATLSIIRAHDGTLHYVRGKA